MKNIIFLSTLFLFICSSPLFADIPDTLFVADLSRDAVGECPKGWERVVPPKQYSSTSYTVEYTGTGPYIHTSSNSTGSWIELSLNDIDINVYPFIEWDWMVNIFPQLEWERSKKNDDFSIRIELVFDYKGGKTPLNIIKKGLITSLFKHYPPEMIISYVWAVHVPVDEGYISPSSSRMVVIPIESDTFTIRRWIHEKRDILADYNKYKPDEKLFIKNIRIRTDTENSGTTADSGVKNILFIAKNK